MLSSKQKLRVVSKATISTSEDDSSDGEVKKRISGQLVLYFLIIINY